MKKLLHSKLFKDLCIVVASTVTFSLILQSFDAFEWLIDFTRIHEDWELDEIVLALLLSPLILCWFSYRRWNEAKQEIKKRMSRERELLDVQKQLSYSALHDVLTGLANRTLLTDRLHQAMAKARRQNSNLAVIYVDVDNFKSINDLHGHDVGDQLLVTLAARMKRVFRAGDTIARFGGDEFVAVLGELPKVTDAQTILDRLLVAISRPLHLDDLVLQVSASLGVTFYPQRETVDPDHLIRQADQAMYQAKLEGKANYSFFDIEQDRYARGYHANLEDIRRGLNEREFLLYYQPKVNMRTGEVIGAEALVRWQHPQKGLLMPISFLPVIEEHPLALELGDWVVEAALKQMEAWRGDGLDISLSVNIGACQLMQPDFIARMQSLLDAQSDIDPEKLVLEVLETSAIKDINHVTRVMRTCQGLGVKFALDDFGTGYSSLTYLKRLPAHQLKIDRSFIKDMVDNPEDLSIVEGILALAAIFQRQVIAEGVETVEHGKCLLQAGCELAQGYGIARPMPAAELPDWIRGWRPDAEWAGQSPARLDAPSGAEPNLG